MLYIAVFISCIVIKTGILYVCAVCTVYCAVCTAYCAACTALYVLSCVYCAVCTVLFVPCCGLCAGCCVYYRVIHYALWCRRKRSPNETPAPLSSSFAKDFPPSCFQMGGWRKRSLIDDAKFETLANMEFEKRERNLSNTDIPEHDDVFTQNGVHPSATKDGVVITSYVIKLKEGLGSISRILKLFEVG